MKNIKNFEEFLNESLNSLNEKLDLKLSTNEYPIGIVARYRLESDIINLRKIFYLSREPWTRNAKAFTDNELGFESASDRKTAMTAIQKSFDTGQNDIREYVLENELKDTCNDKEAELYEETGSRDIFLKLSDIDHTRIIKWMSNQFDDNTWEIKKSGSGFEINIDKLSKHEQEDLMNYLKSQSYINENNPGDKLKHKYNPAIEIELIEPTNKGWKVYQIEKGKKKIAHFDKQDISGNKSLFH